jgi:hypothetical protein
VRQVGGIDFAVKILSERHQGPARSGGQLAALVLIIFFQQASECLRPVEPDIKSPRADN